MPKKRKRKPNRGSFQPGYDPRRHILTRAERRRGYKAAMAVSDPHLLAWVYRKVRGYFRARKRETA